MKTTRLLARAVRMDVDVMYAHDITLIVLSANYKISLSDTLHSGQRINQISTKCKVLPLCIDIDTALTVIA